jgi:hypothetical protein
VYLGRVGSTEAYFAFDGDADVDVQAAVDVVSAAIGGGSTYSADPNLELGPVRSTVDVIAAGLAIFALLAAAAGLIAPPERKKPVQLSRERAWFAGLFSGICRAPAS